MEPSAILEQFGFGGLAGFAVGYTAKKFTRLAAVLLGLLFLLFQFLASKGLIEPNWKAIEETAQHAIGPESLLAKLSAVATHHLPFGGAFAVGFFLGFRQG